MATAGVELAHGPSRRHSGHLQPCDGRAPRADWRSSSLKRMSLVSWVTRRSSAAQTRVRQLSPPGTRPITLVGRLTSPRDRSSRLVDRHRGGEAALIELVDQGLAALFGGAVVDGFVERLPVGVLDAFVLAFGQLGVRGSHPPQRPTAAQSEPQSPPTAVRYVSRRRLPSIVLGDVREPTPTPRRHRGNLHD
jgi:hypothetical protein